MSRLDDLHDAYAFNDCDEMTLCALAVLAEVRRRLGGRWSAIALVDAYAQEIVDEYEGDDG